MDYPNGITESRKQNTSKYCRYAGITYKSPHSTRRATASRLSTAGIPSDKIRDILGFFLQEPVDLLYLI